MKDLIDTEGLDKYTKLRLLLTQILLIIGLPILIISEFDNPLYRIVLFLLWVGTIEDTSPFIQKHFTNKLLGIKKDENKDQETE